MHWDERSSCPELSRPGVYVIAISSQDISGTPFSWIPEIVYVGMTNSRGGLKSRLAQFDRTIKGGEGHGGAKRVRFKHRKPATLIPKLYVAIRMFKCDPSSDKPRDLRNMGKVAKCEYECLASFNEEFGRLPEFNDKKRSPKKRRCHEKRT